MAFKNVVCGTVLLVLIVCCAGQQSAQGSGNGSAAKAKAQFAEVFEDVCPPASNNASALQPLSDQALQSANTTRDAYRLFYSAVIRGLISLPTACMQSPKDQVEIVRVLEGCTQSSTTVLRFHARLPLCGYSTQVAVLAKRTIFSLLVASKARQQSWIKETVPEKCTSLTSPVEGVSLIKMTSLPSQGVAAVAEEMWKLRRSSLSGLGSCDGKSAGKIFINNACQAVTSAGIIYVMDFSAAELTSCNTNTAQLQGSALFFPKSASQVPLDLDVLSLKNATLAEQTASVQAFTDYYSYSGRTSGAIRG